MAGRSLTQADKEYIRENRLTVSANDMANHLGCYPSTVCRALKSMGLSLTIQQVASLRGEKRKGFTTSTPAIDQVIREGYLDTPPQKLADLVGKSETFIKTRIRQLGLVIPREIVERRKLESRIQAGSTPFNKGRKQAEYMSPGAIQKTAASRFKKGNLPRNTKEDGVITIRKDNRGVPYNFIRVSLGKWQPLHRYRWQQAFGPIPKGMKLRFKDGDTMNCDLTNLELLSAADMMKLNTVHNWGEEVAWSVQLRGALNRQINKHKKRLK